MVGERRRPVPTERRRLGRRRARVRALARYAVPMAVSAVVVVLAVSAVAQIGAASGPYRRTVDRGYAALAAPLVADSNTSGAALVAFLRSAPSLGRVPFFSDLGALVADTAALVRRYEAIARPGPSDAAQCLSALSERATAVADLRSALEAVLGGPTGLGVVAEDADVTAAAAAAAALRAADGDWASCRRTVRRDPGSASLAVSVWVHARGPLEDGSIAPVVDAIAASHTLAPVHDLQILGVVTEPQAVASGTTLVVPATQTVQADVVLADRGNVDEDGVELGGEATVQGATANAVLVQRTFDVSAGRSTTLALRPFKVVPGSSYTLQVVAESPKSTGAGALASRTITVQVQPVATLTAVTSSPLVVIRGRPVTLIANIASALAGAPAPTGTVAFADDGTTVPGCAAQPVRAGQATCSVTYSTVSAHAITGAYSGTRATRPRCRRPSP